MNARRSRSRPATPSSSPVPATKTCRNEGSTALAPAPIIESSTGTLRQPSTVRPSPATIFAMARAAASASVASAGRKAIPVA